MIKAANNKMQPLLIGDVRSSLRSAILSDTESGLIHRETFAYGRPNALDGINSSVTRQFSLLTTTARQKEAADHQLPETSADRVMMSAVGP